MNALLLITRKCIIKFQCSSKAVDPLMTTVSREATKTYNNNTSESLNAVKLISTVYSYCGMHRIETVL